MPAQRTPPGNPLRAFLRPLYRRLRCFLQQVRYTVRPHGFLNDALREMKGLPLIGSLRMISLGFLPLRQKTYGLGQWPSRRQTGIFLTDEQRERMFFASASRLRYRRLFDDKVRFAELVGAFAPTPPLVAVIESGRVFPTAADVPTPDAAGLIAAALAHNGLVLKPRDSSLGLGVHLLLPADGQVCFDREPVPPAALEKKLLGLNNYIVTPKAHQARYASDIFARTANTIRIVTMVDPADGEAFVAYAVHRIGSEASFPVDNFSQGGLYCAVDMESGKLNAALMRDRRWHAQHPDTGAQIEGVVIPRWPQLLQALTALSQRLDFTEYIGWDVVVTDDGFTVIEGNYNPQTHQTLRPLLTNERIRAFYRHHLSFRQRSSSPAR